MLELLGKKFSSCDRLTRRNLLRVGALGLGSLSLPQILAHRAQAAASGQSLPKTSVIFIEMAGGPTQIETYDPKPTAPQEYRGPLGTVPTNVSGVHFSQMMSQQAKIMDKLAIIRSLETGSGSHQSASHLTQTGYFLRDRQNRNNEMPSIGSISAKLRGSAERGIPAYVALNRTMRYGNAAYAGKAFNPFEVRENPNRDNFSVDNLALNRRLTLDRVDDRKCLLDELDQHRRLTDLSGVSEAYDQFTLEAFDMVTSGKAQKAFDLSQEKDSLRDAYGHTRTGQEMLLARRLIEAGVTFVTIRNGGWDDHNRIENRMKGRVPEFDQGVAALVSDLYERGLDQEVLLVAMGEFGRTPKINNNAGRDHWGNLMSVMLSGGGLRVGQVVGSSNNKGEIPQESPYRPENVLAMVYRHMGIDPATTLPDLSGRPRYLLEERGLIEELI